MAKFVRDESSVGAVIGEVMVTDEAVRDAYRQLLIAGARQMQRLLVTGTPEERTAILKTIIPHAMKSLVKQETSAQDVAMQEAFERIKAAVNGSSS